MLMPKEDWEGSPIFCPIVRRPVAVAAPPHQLASFVLLAEGSTHPEPHIEEQQEESQVVGSLFHHHLHLSLLLLSQNHPLPWSGLHTVWVHLWVTGPFSFFKLSLFSSIEVSICTPIVHWSPLWWQQAPEIRFFHAFPSLIIHPAPSRSSRALQSVHCRGLVLGSAK